jgi:hypothetical protein
MEVGELGAAFDMVLFVEPIVSLDLACSTSMRWRHGLMSLMVARALFGGVRLWRLSPFFNSTRYKTEKILIYSSTKYRFTPKLFNYSLHPKM